MFKINIAIQGCSHGELTKIYSQIEKMEKETNEKIDLLICCGDFQSIRNKGDLACMSVPNKYKKMGDFYMYYNGEKKAPIKTIFVGGNHEASNYLWELPYGGWVADNIYYMGYSNSIIYKGIRISGISGIYKEYNYEYNHYERPPFTNETLKSIYHSRSIDIYRLSLLPKNKIDIFISHDWPTNVYNYNDITDLLKIKPYFKEQIDLNTLGDPYKFELLKNIQPKNWVSAHLHCYFESKIVHNDTNETTNFLALDKCIKNRCFLKIINIDITEEKNNDLYYDPYWIEILLKTEKYIKNENAKYKVLIPNEIEKININDDVC